MGEPSVSAALVIAPVLLPVEANAAAVDESGDTIGVGHCVCKPESRPEGVSEHEPLPVPEVCTQLIEVGHEPGQTIVDVGTRPPASSLVIAVSAGLVGNQVSDRS